MFLCLPIHGVSIPQKIYILSICFHYIFLLTCMYYHKYIQVPIASNRYTIINMCSGILAPKHKHTYMGATTLKINPCFSNFSFIYTCYLHSRGWVGVLHSPPLYLGIVLSALYIHIYKKFIKKRGYYSLITFSCYHVAYLQLKWVHCTFTKATTWFQSTLTFSSKIHIGWNWNYTLGSTWIMFQ